MSRRVVIADAGPLIGLARIDALPLLRDLFGQVCITCAVRDELLPSGRAFSDTERMSRALAEGWIEVVDEPDSEWKPLNPCIDAGEASTIRTARHWRNAGDAVMLVMDDRAGRREAKSQGIAFVGTAAVIGLAKIQGLIPAARPLLERLTQAGYYLGRTLIEAVLADVDE